MGNSFLQTKIGAGRLMGPKGVAVDRNGHIIVVDNKSCCVFTFQPNGKLVGRFGGRGATDRHFAGIGGGFGDLVPETPAPENSPMCPSSKDPFSYIVALGEPVPALCPSSTIPETPPSPHSPALPSQRLFPAPLSLPAYCQRAHFVFSGPHFVAVNNKNEIVVTDFHNHSVKVSAPPPSVATVPASFPPPQDPCLPHLPAFSPEIIALLNKHL